MTETVIASSLLILLILLVRRLFEKKLSRRFLYGLWLVAAVRLLLLPCITVPQNVFVMRVLCRPVEKISEEVNAKVNSLVFQPGDAQENVWEATQNADETFFESNFSNFHILQEEGLTLSSVLAILWMAGIVITLCILLIPLLRFYCFIRKKRELYEKVPDIKLKVFTVEGLETPCLLWNSIYVPREMVAGKEQYEYAKLHEITHYRHLDPLWNFVRLVAVCVYWFHPLVWVAAFQSKQDGEMACDEGVTARLNEEETKQYGKVLLELAAGRSFQRNDLLTHSGMTEGDVLRRIKAMLTPTASQKGIAVIVVVMLLLVSGVTLQVDAAEQGMAVFTKAEGYSAYPESTEVKILKCLYQKDSLLVEFLNSSQETSLILVSKLEYYREADSVWVMVKKSDIGQKTMYAVPPEQAEKMQVLSNIQKSRVDSMVIYANKVEEDIAQTYGSLPDGKYRMLYLLMKEDGTEEIVYACFEETK